MMVRNRQMMMRKWTGIVGDAAGSKIVGICFAKRIEYSYDRGDDVAQSGSDGRSDTFQQTLIANLNVGYVEEKVVDHSQNMSCVGLEKFQTRRGLNYRSRLD